MLVFFGFIIASLGSLTPSFLNLTVVKISLRNGTRPALFLVGGFATILFIQANIGAYLASILMKNSEYLVYIQQIGAGILLLLSMYFLRLHFNSEQSKKDVEIENSEAYFKGLGLSSLNTFAIPFYFTSISFLIGLKYFEYSFMNGIYFSIGSTLGSFTIYSLFAIIASKVEHKLTILADKINLILGCLTGFVGLGNLIYLLFF